MNKTVEDLQQKKTHKTKQNRTGSCAANVYLKIALSYQTK